MKPSHFLPTIVVSVIGIAGVLVLLFAWHLPPFTPAQPTTTNAYIRGNVTSLAPQLSGYIDSVEVTDFDEVREGDVIARLDDRIYRQQLRQAEANLASAKAALKVARQEVTSAEAVARAAEATVGAARSTLETAQSDWTRVQRLRDRDIASDASADQSRLALRQAEAGVTEAEAQLDIQREALESAKVALDTRAADIASAEAAVETARINLENTVIRAPADGRLGQVSAHAGQFVSAGTGLVSHVGRDVWVIANFKETGLHGVRIGQPVHFTVDAVGGHDFRGHVEAFSPATASEFSLLSGSNATGNFTKIAQRLPVRIAIDPGQDMIGELAPGLSVVVDIDTLAETDRDLAGRPLFPSEG
ncbi:HlyD family secretion protein [Allosediminivita pacifica]|uniref:Multidrug resistance efflux pump n=1 Tax=Allosediminivita pacifica TaxID=1267769 RepID=A0A2T6B7X1_9RHOB|nr:HlyD family secretion protein [Allosediminivita pacifica]PTX52122.1 multidrug resistance efflux pump [Allosediminivita pacifica]GGA96963.1 hemolysin secretion protein D [Allosediminivita pacifica]